MSLPSRPGLEHVAAYRPGKPAPVGHDGLSAKLSSNENPYDPLPSVAARVQACLPAAINRYPDHGAVAIGEAVAARFGVQYENVVFGSGSVEVAGQLIHAVTGPGDEVMFAWRSFEAYPILVRSAGAVPVEVPLDAGARHDLDAMADAITDRTRLIFVCNPNNPTGTVVDRADFERFLARVPENVVVVVDEAYTHFDRGAESPRGIDYFGKFPNVVVLHTFSKAYGLAGLRIGYAIAPVELADDLRKVSIPFAVSALAQEGALASLDAEGELQERVDQLVAERERMEAQLAALGVSFVPSQANFVWLPAGERSDELAAQFAERGISVRYFPGDGMRISIGLPVENDAVLEVAAKFVA